MRHSVKLFCAALAASLLLVALAGAAAIGGGLVEDGEAAYRGGDYATALRLYRSLADQGSATAQFYLGVMYANGQGVTQSYAEAVKWFRLAANQGDANAQFNVGVMYERGQGVPQKLCRGGEVVSPRRQSRICASPV
jgi:uncharacterized protein